MASEKIEVVGLKELEDALKDLPVKLQASIYKALNRKAVKKFVVDEIRSVVNYSSKTESNITVINDKSDPTSVYGGVSSKVYWLRFADRGTASRETKKGANRGAIKGKNQIQPVILASVDKIIKFVNDELGNETAKILEKRLKNVNTQLINVNTFNSLAK